MGTDTFVLHELDAIIDGSSNTNMPSSPLAPANRDLLTPTGHLTIAGALTHASIHDPNHPYLLLHYRRYEAGRAEVIAHDLAPIEDFHAPGPLSACIPDLAEGLLEHAVVRLHDAGLSRQLFDELLVNAIGHRSFAPEHRGDPVSIRHYTDCIRITSPGPLCDKVVLNDKILEGRHSRNPRLMAALTRQGLARQAGMGLAWAQRLAPELGFRLHHEADEHSVTAVLTIDPALAIRADARQRREERRLRLPAGQLERRILEILEDGHARASKELQQQLGMPMSTVNAALRRLVKLGHVAPTEKRARSPKQRYRLAPQRD